MSFCVPNCTWTDKYFTILLEIFEEPGKVHWRDNCNLLYIIGTNPRCRMTVKINGVVYESVKTIADVCKILFNGAIDSQGRMTDLEIKTKMIAALSEGSCIRVLKSAIDFRDFYPVAGPQYCILAVCDGVRYSESIETPANIPNIMNISATGSLLTLFNNDGLRTETQLGHSAMMSGFYEDMPNNGSRSRLYPSYMSEWLYANNIASSTNGDTDRCKIITSKDKLWALRKADTALPWNNHIPYANCGVNGEGGGGYRADALTHSIFMSECLGANPPIFSMVSYAETDSYAHDGDWAGYINALQEFDTRINEIWTTVQSHPLMANKTLLIITNDHGRATPNWQNHGGTSASERHVMFVAAGPLVKSGYTSGVAHSLNDIPATILSFFGMVKTTGDGSILSIKK